MVVLVQEAWSDRDDASLAALRIAVGRDDLAGALFAIDDADTDDCHRCDDLLNEWATTLGASLDRADLGQCAVAMRELLARELRFRGDVQDYYCPENVRLSTVMKQRKGMPILLAAVWMEVGRRAGLEMHGIGMPGHFIARVGGAAGPLVDPFSGGCELSVKQCAHIVGRVSNSALPWHDAYLEPVECGAIIDRVLRNVMHVQRRAKDTVGLYRAAVFHAGLRPDEPEPQLLHACLAEEIGAFRLAERLYRHVAETFAGQREAVVARRRVAKVRRRVLLMH